MSDLVGLEFRFPDLGAKFSARYDEIMLFAAAVIQTNRALMFDDSNAGRTPWPKPKLRDGQPLTISKTLRNSFAPHNGGDRPVLGPDGIVEITADVITIGTKIAYARVLNDGAVILPKRFPVLWIPLPDGSPKSANAPSKLTKSLIKGHKVDKRTTKEIAKLKKRYEKTKSEALLHEIEHLKGEKRQPSDGAPIVQGKNGKYYLLAKKATIPARPMDEWVPADQQELEEALTNKIEQVFMEIMNG